MAIDPERFSRPEVATRALELLLVACCPRTGEGSRPHHSAAQRRRFLHCIWTDGTSFEWGKEKMT